MTFRFLAGRSFVRSRVAIRTAVFGLALGLVPSLGGCGDSPHFDAKQYQIVITSAVLQSAASAGFLQQPETWLFKTESYTPLFCTNGATTTATSGASSVLIDWHGCAYGGSDLVGELEYAGKGEYEGLVDVTFTLNGSETLLPTWVRLVPADLPAAE